MGEITGQATDLIGKFISLRKREEEKTARDVFAFGEFAGRKYSVGLHRSERIGWFIPTKRVVWVLSACDQTPRTWGDRLLNHLQEVYREDDYRVARLTFDLMVRTYGLKVA